MNSITIENFKLFKKPITIDFGDVTILTGKNNSGKSSFIKALMFLSDFHKDGRLLKNDYNGPLSHKSRINSGDEILKDKKENNIISFIQVYDDYRIVFKCQVDEKRYDLVEFSISFDPRGIDELKGVLSFKREEDSIEIFLNNQFIAVHSSHENHAKWYSYVSNLKSLSHIREEIKKLKEKNLSSKELKSQEREISKQNDSLRKEFFALINLYKEKSLDIKGTIDDYFPNYGYDPTDNNSLIGVIDKEMPKYLESLETKAKLKGLIDNSFYSRINSYGQIGIDHTGPDRINMSRALQLHSTELGLLLENYRKLSDEPATADVTKINFINKWLKFFELGDGLKIKFIENEIALIKIKNRDKWENLSNLGFGSRQIITLILKMYVLLREAEDNFRSEEFGEIPRNRMNRTIDFVIIEEPESNLHPLLQSKLADFFYDVVHLPIAPRLRLIIETHSEYFIRRTQVLVKEGKVNPFKVYYFDSEKGPYEMKYREDGIFENDFGSGFFDEADTQAIKLIYRS